MPRRVEPAKLAWWAGAGALTASIALPLNEAFRIMVGWYSGMASSNPDAGVVALAATAVYLPLHLRHVVHGLRGSRPPGDRWTLAAMAVVIIGTLPFVGLTWSSALASLAISVLILLRPPISLILTAALVATPAVVAVVAGVPAFGLYFVNLVAFRTSAVFVLVWMAGAIRRLQSAQGAVATLAVDQERLRIGDELNQALGSTLEEIIATGQRLAPLAEHDQAAARIGLTDLVGRSRRTLAETRRLVAGYRDASLRAELDSVQSVLRAGGIDPRLVVPPSGLPDSMAGAERDRLYTAVAELLHDETVRSCVLIVSVHSGGARVDLNPVVQARLP
jgi:two-component system, NarL family, sensor histidine kinase DesK